MARTLRQVWNMCGKKRAFKSERAAKQHAAPWPLRVYQCPICHYWHTTSFRVVTGGESDCLQNDVASPADLE